jgi:hypothetical protein
MNLCLPAIIIFHLFLNDSHFYFPLLWENSNNNVGAWIAQGLLENELYNILYRREKSIKTDKDNVTENK